MGHRSRSAAEAIMTAVSRVGDCRRRNECKPTGKRRLSIDFTHHDVERPNNRWHVRN
jgi:hypothetical protein